MPNFYTLTVLLVIFPFAFIASTLGIDVDTFSVGFIISPIPLVNVSIYVMELSLTLCEAILPLTFVDCPISPFHGTLPVAESS